LEEQTRQRVEELETLMHVVPVAIFIGHDQKCHNITGNRMANELYEAKLGENVSANVSHLRRLFHNGLELTADELPMQKAAFNDIDVRYEEIDLILPSGEKRGLLGSASPLHDAEGNVRGSIGAFIDITERKEAEAKLKETLDNLDKLIKVRTAELENAYILLKESEERLADAQKIAHVGSYDWNIATNEEYWSDELYHIFELYPQFELNHNTFLNRINPEDLDYVSHAINEALNGKPYNIDYRIILPDGEERVIYSQGGVIFDEKNTPIRMRGIVQDITERKKAEESLERIEIARKKEIHHRIKNNLQVISSLLDLQAEMFRNRPNIRDSEVLEAFRESQDRVISMALIHEELHRGEGFEKLNFSSYIEELAENLLHTYRLGNPELTLCMDLEENILFDIDIAVPLGIIINELVSNSLKYAFPEKNDGKIKIKLHREEGMDTNFILVVSDNGVGISEDLDIENLDSLGLQLVTSLVDQLEGELELNRNNGTEFIIRFTVAEKSDQALAPALSN
jgi:PAS domain S-box-containing protein